MSTGNIPLNPVIADQLITSALWNAEFGNIQTLTAPEGIESYEDTDAETQIQTNPYPGSVLSKASSLAGEIERIRYQLAQILGTTYWYDPAPTDLTTVGDVITPIGGVIDYPSATPPNSKWHLADGTAISRTTYATLFALIGTTFGAGDNATTFNLPDYRDRMSIGAGTTYPLAQTGGAATATASHSHTVNSHTHDLGNHTHLLDYSLAGEGSASYSIFSSDSDGALLFAGTGGGGATGRSVHNITKVPSTNTSGAATPGTDTQAPTVQVLNPYLSMYKIIRVI